MGKAKIKMWNLLKCLAFYRLPCPTHSAYFYFLDCVRIIVYFGWRWRWRQANGLPYIYIYKNALSPLSLVDNKYEFESTVGPRLAALAHPLAPV